VATESKESGGLDLVGEFPVRRAKNAVSVVAVLVVWALLTLSGLLSVLPSPQAVAVAFVDLLVTGTYWNAVFLSTGRVVVAFLLATLLAVPLGLLIGRSPVFADLTFPSLEMLRPIPPIAWLPLTILLFPALQVSVGVATWKVKANVLFITGLGAFFPILLNTIDGVKDVDIDYSRAAESLGASDRQVFRHVVLPAALPDVYTGMVVGIGLAWVNLVAAEMIAGAGLGFLTWAAYTAGNFATIIVGMISIGILGYLSSALVRVAGDRLLDWNDGAETE
jgi:NitT/TauT family transport system permease protein